MSVPKKVIVAGASGLIGQAAIERFAAAGYDVLGVARRVPAIKGPAEAVSLDLMDAKACRAVVAEHPDATHLVYAALYELPGLVPGWFDPDAINRNLTMLSNLFAAIEAAGCELQHVSLMHGTKAYGLHAGIEVTSEMIPLRERSPRIEHHNFYFEQERFLQERQHHRAFGLTVFRPTVVYGVAMGNNMNPLLPILVYAALLREVGEPLHRPWSSDRPAVLQEAVDADLIGDAVRWAAEAPSAWDETFNLTNGDQFLWEGVWPAIARAMGMEVGDHRPISFTEAVRSRGEEWAAIVERHRLAAPPDLDAFVGFNSFVYADIVVSGAGGAGRLPLVNSTIKARQAGFCACVDTEDMFVGHIERLQGLNLIPRSAL